MARRRGQRRPRSRRARSLIGPALLLGALALPIAREQHFGLDYGGFCAAVIALLNGHATGDALLASVAIRIRETVGPQGVVGRLGGDEFAVVVADPDPATLSRRLLAALEHAGSGGQAVAASLGIALMPRDIRDELELAVLKTALQLLPARPAGSLLSVNPSGPMLLDRRTQALLDARPTLSGLIVEVTENSLLEATADLHAEITVLLARDVRFAVDDIGAGYSGLRQMTTLRPSYLKLDRSLIRDIDSDSHRAAPITALLAYARQTGGHLVAEGVETAAELATLTELGVPLVQGFYLGGPDVPWPDRSPAPQATRRGTGRRGVMAHPQAALRARVGRRHVIGDRLDELGPGRGG